VTGASSGIGLELAAICAQQGFDLLIAADQPEIHTAADRCRNLGAETSVVGLTSPPPVVSINSGRRRIAVP
jgi:NAD(P)-dependent dehydrogenase (short-subunit alcohol dehydrogenase family)